MALDLTLPVGIARSSLDRRPSHRYWQLVLSALLYAFAASVALAQIGFSGPVNYPVGSSPLAITSGNPPGGTVGTAYGPVTTAYLSCVWSPVLGWHEVCTPCVPGSCPVTRCRGISLTPCLQIEQVHVGFTFTASGGMPPYIWSATGVPSGLALVAGTGHLADTPNMPGAYNVVVTVSDSELPPVQASASYVIDVSNGVALSSDTTLSLTTGPEPSIFGQPLTFTATVTPANATGMVEFDDGGGQLATVPLSGDVATYTTSSTSPLPVGVHTITATYLGVTNTILPSTSTPLVEVVVSSGAPGSAATALNATPITSSGTIETFFRQSANFSVAVSPTSGTGTPTGTVVLLDGANQLGSLLTLDAKGSASSATPLTPGVHNITAIYLGDVNFNGGSSATCNGTPASMCAVQASPRPHPSGLVFGIAATHFSVVAPASAIPGTPFNFTVIALDAANNVAAGYSGTVHFTSTDSHAALPADNSLANGMATFSATLNTIGVAQTITATDTTNLSITGVSNQIIVSGMATHFSVAAPGAAAAGKPFNFTVTALDAANNVAVGYPGTVHFTSSDGAANLPADAMLVNGTNIFTATLNTLGPQSIMATDTVNASITGISNSITVAKIVITSGAPPVGTVGSTYDPHFVVYYVCTVNPFITCVRKTGLANGSPLSAIGGTSSYTWSWAPAAGSSLPPGLDVINVLNRSLCGIPGVFNYSPPPCIGGMPTQAGTYNVIVTVTDSESPPATAEATYTITIK